MVVNRGFRMGKTFVKVAFHWLSTVIYGWGKIFAEVAFYWLSTMVSGWKKLSQRSQFIGYQPWFPDWKNFRRSRIRFFLPSPPHDFPCPFRIAIGLDTCLAALPTDSSLDSTSPARQTQGRLPASHSFRIATDSQPSAMASRRKDDRGTCVHFRVFRNRE